MNKKVEKVKKDEAVLLDVRRDDEWNEEHAEEAMHFDIARLKEGELPDIPKDKQIYTHCKAGGRAGQAKNILMEAGFEKVENIGGLEDWKNMKKKR